MFQYVPYEYSWRGHMDGLRARSRHWESREGRLVSNPVVARGEDVLQVLGVSWGYLPHRGSVYDASGQALPQYVDENTGIMCVVPASKINDLLYHQDVVVLREHQTAERSAEGDGETTAAVATTEPSEESGGAPPFTREEFIGALREVSPPKPST